MGTPMLYVWWRLSNSLQRSYTGAALATCARPYPLDLTIPSVVFRELYDSAPALQGISFLIIPRIRMLCAKSQSIQNLHCFFHL